MDKAATNHLTSARHIEFGMTIIRLSNAEQPCIQSCSLRLASASLTALNTMKLLFGLSCGSAKPPNSHKIFQARVHRTMPLFEPSDTAEAG